MEPGDRAAPPRQELRQRLAENINGLPRPVSTVGTLNLGNRTKLGHILTAPSKLSLTDGRDAFLGLIYDFQMRTYGMTRQERGNINAWMIDLSSVEEITLDAALVLTAEYHRQLIQTGYKPRIEDAKWNPKVRGLLHQLGFYSLVSAASSSNPDEPDLDEDLSFVPFKVGSKVAPVVARELHTALTQAAGQEPEKAYVIASLVETTKNVRHHAYEGANRPDRPPAVGLWWAAGSYEPRTRMLQFAVYDQGVGIPETLPRRPFYQSVLRFCPPERTDADLIAGALRLGRTRYRSKRGLSTAVDESARGSGLWSLCEFIPRGGGSSVEITSGHGKVRYAGGRAVEKTHFKNPFCGTLILWNLQLPICGPNVEAVL